MKGITCCVIISSLFIGWSASKNSAGTANDRKALEQTSIAIRLAFASYNIPAIISYHNPDVVKALG